MRSIIEKSQNLETLGCSTLNQTGRYASSGSTSARKSSIWRCGATPYKLGTIIIDRLYQISRTPLVTLL